MSSFLAEATVRIRPDTTKFRAELEAQLAAATKGIVVPVAIAATAAGSAGAASQTAALTAASVGAADAANLQAEATLNVADAAATAGASEQKELAVKSALDKATRLLAQSQAQLAGVDEVASLKTTELAAARARLSETTGAAAVAQKAFNTALLTQDSLLKENAASTLVDARSKEVLARDAVLATIAMNKEAAAAATAASSHEFAARGATTQGLSLLGLRGATLAANYSFIIGAAGAIALTKSVKQASDATEQLNKSIEVFGPSSKAVIDFAATAARSFGLANAEALKLSSTFGALLRPIGFTQKAAADESVALTKLGADLASFYNTDVSSALAAIESGLVGQARPLREYGVQLSAARVQALALAQTGKTTASSLTDQEKALARINIIFQDSTLAQGDFARTSQELANSQRILKAEISNLSEELGKLTTGPLTFVVRGLAKVVDGLDLTAKGLGDLKKRASEPIKIVVDFVTPGSKGDQATEFFKRIAKESLFLVGNLKELQHNLLETSAAFENLTGLDVVTFPTVKQAKKDIVDLLAELNKAGGSPTKFNEIVVKLQEMQKELAGGTDQTKLLAKSLDPFIADLQKISQQPDIVLPIKLPPGLLDGTLAKEAGRVSGAATAKEFANQISGDFGFSNFIKVAKEIAKNAAEQAGNVFVVGFSNVFKDAVKATRQGVGRQAGLEDLMNQILIGGGDSGAQLGNLQKQADNQQRVINKAVAGLQDLTSGDKGFATLTKALRSARSKLVGIQSQQQTIRDGINADRAKAQTDALKKQADADQALLNAQQTARTQQENLIKAADLTPTLKDDIKRQSDYRDLLKTQIAKIREQGKLTSSQKDAILALKSKILDVVGTLKSLADAQKKLAEDQKKLIEEQKQAAKDRITSLAARGLKLAELTGNKDEILLFLNASIADAKKRVKAAKTLTDKLDEQIALQELINQKNDLLKQKQQDGKVAQKFLFEQLQAQQGFAANLFGNLIPSAATGGLVGGGASVGAGLGPAAAAQEAKSQAGITSGQGQTTNHILTQILQQLKALNGDHATPEATRQRRLGHHIFDGVEGG